jgi:hypothetical protein
LDASLPVKKKQLNAPFSKKETISQQAEFTFNLSQVAITNLLQTPIS